jgi:hypothetical protein
MRLGRVRRNGLGHRRSVECCLETISFNREVAMFPPGQGAHTNRVHRAQVTRQLLIMADGGTWVG